MSATDRAKHATRHRRGLLVETLEARGLMSIIPYLTHHVPAVGTTTLRRRCGGGAFRNRLECDRRRGGDVRSTDVSRGGPTALLGQGLGELYDRAGAIHGSSAQGQVNAEGMSNQSLRVFLQMRFFVPTDPTQPTTGVASITLKNTSTTGTQLILDLTAAPQIGSSRFPSQFTWTVDPSSAGFYLNAGGFGMGQGTLDIHYAPGGNRPANTFSAGRAFVVVNGMINTIGGFTSVSVVGSQG